MFRIPYRPCPMCRAQLARLAEKDSHDGWEWYHCNQNCGSLICVMPFARKVDRRVDSVSRDRGTE